ncbi:Rieske (2Fe-2S) protein [Bradyrhizobium sp. NP1]|uniref:Rieske (2Fe-2S) protein n=1 Tax=Bradyrhizobium sp. NP1 TaxID=3049772 RepID=UPI0025A54530|nr:Rieske (2Fe-2S) protein [Bradyrhizobium sp. NP1]WJR75862.1 Rieske (2Fe-2S) protein [Bradyrhizobium sp. NP1]
MAKHVVCKLEELDVGKITSARIGRSPIILSKLPSGEIRAVGGRCPHQGADLSYGCISGTTASDRLNEMTFCNFGETLRCPWHGFSFSLIDGLPVVKDATQMPMKLRFYDVKVEGGDVVITT